MTVAVSPFVSFVSEEGKQEMIQYLIDISAHTIPAEPGCFAYCWFLPTADGPSHPCLRGLEVYTNEDALAVIHRSSAPYKVMRAAIDRGDLLAPPTPNLTFRTPSGVGFISKSTEVELLTPKTFVIMSEYSTKGGEHTVSLLKALEVAAASVFDKTDVLSYWALKLLDPETDTNIMVFERYTSKDAYDAISAKTNSTSPLANGHDRTVVKSTWIGTGVGFVRGMRL